jgi:uncharacterized membrane protein YGL010W
MKSIQQWYDEYAESHQNPTNQKMHFINVPIIYFSIIGLFMSINPSFLQEKIGLANPLIENWATILLIFILTFYLRLSFSVFLKMFVFSVISVVGNYYIQQNFNLLYISIILFVLAWAGQFYGHKIEGKKPSFFKDLQFLLIGPPWVFKKMFKTN